MAWCLVLPWGPESPPRLWPGPGGHGVRVAVVVRMGLRPLPAQATEGRTRGRPVASIRGTRLGPEQRCLQRGQMVDSHAKCWGCILHSGRSQGHKTPGGHRRKKRRLCGAGLLVNGALCVVGASGAGGWPCPIPISLSPNSLSSNSPGPFSLLSLQYRGKEWSCWDRLEVRAIGEDGQAMTVRELLAWLQEEHGWTVTKLLRGSTMLYDGEEDEEMRAQQQAQR